MLDASQYSLANKYNNIQNGIAFAQALNNSPNSVRSNQMSKQDSLMGASPDLIISNFPNDLE